MGGNKIQASDVSRSQTLVKLENKSFFMKLFSPSFSLTKQKLGKCAEGEHRGNVAGVDRALKNFNKASFGKKIAVCLSVFSGGRLFGQTMASLSKQNPNAGE
jgi:hypothetical protein